MPGDQYYNETYIPVHEYFFGVPEGDEDFSSLSSSLTSSRSEFRLGGALEAEAEELLLPLRLPLRLRLRLWLLLWLRLRLGLFFSSSTKPPSPLLDLLSALPLRLLFASERLTLVRIFKKERSNRNSTSYLDQGCEWILQSSLIVKLLNACSSLSRIQIHFHCFLSHFLKTFHLNK